MLLHFGYFTHEKRNLKAKANYQCVCNTDKSFGWNFIKKETPAQVFSCEFCEISKNIFFKEHIRTTASGLDFCYHLSVFHGKRNWLNIAPRVQIRRVRLFRKKRETSRLSFPQPELVNESTSVAPKKKTQCNLIGKVYLQWKNVSYSLIPFPEQLRHNF